MNESDPKLWICNLLLLRCSANGKKISTRAAITTTSFTNHYEWRDLKANPSKLLEKYFDAFVYVANLGDA